MKKHEHRRDNEAGLVRIPRIEHRIYTRNPGNREKTYVEFIYDKYDDPEMGKKVYRKTIIGTSISGLFQGLMIANSNYFKYFDKDGYLYNDPLKRREERETKTETAEGDERTVDEIKEELLKKEKILDQKIQEAEQKKKEEGELVDQMMGKLKELGNLPGIDHDSESELEEDSESEGERERLELLEDILRSYRDMVDEQAKRKPAGLMSFRQIQMINNLLKKIRTYFTGSNAEDFLQLAEEPIREDLANHPGTTYGEMAIILSPYSHAIHAYKWETLWAKAK